MMTYIDEVLDRITMYRLVLYVLIGFVGIGVVLAYFKLLAFSPLALVISSLFLVVMCWAMNTILARVFEVPTNVESSLITALILALIIDPAQSSNEFQLLGWAAILAMSSKYLLAVRKKHLFNPAALAVVIPSFVLGESASWWVGTASMLPVVLIGGLLVVRKLRQADMVWSFCIAALVSVCIMTFVQRSSILTELKQVLVGSPLFFLAFIMLTEPLTAPPTKKLRRLYGILTGILFLPQIHIASVYATPELALVVGNLFSYMVSPKQKVVLKLNKRSRLASGIVDFAFVPSQKLTFLPGQYMEFTLAHPRPDSRGNRRYFTLASSPTEQMVHLGVRFYEQGSSFKKALSRINSRTTLVGAQVAGDFTLPADAERKLVFIAGGIGITPFRSMLKYLLDVQQKRNIILFYINRTVDEIVYQDVLSMAQTELGIKTFYSLTDNAVSQIKVVYRITKMAISANLYTMLKSETALSALPRHWPGLVGRINEQVIAAMVPDYRERIYYVSGPPEMVKAYEQVLQNMYIKRDQIKKDFFPGLL